MKYIATSEAFASASEQSRMTTTTFGSPVKVTASSSTVRTASHQKIAM